jgi:S-DNA-T family DNA segregation ATPase FtsK/SpoIIIE
MAKLKPIRTGPSLGQEVIALAIFGTGILLLLALFSFDPRDLSFYSQPPQNPKANLVGPAGAYLGGILFLLFGLGSYLFPVVLIAGGLLLFFAKEVHYSRKFLFLGILLVTGACLLQLAAPIFGPSLANPLFSGAHGLDGPSSPAGKMPGGYIGYFMNDKFVAPILGQVGAVLVFGLSYLVVLVLLFEFRPAELARAFGEAGRALVDQYLDYRIRQADPTERIELEQKKVEIQQKRLRRQIAKEKAPQKEPEPAVAIPLNRPAPKIFDSTKNPMPSSIPESQKEKNEKPAKTEKPIKTLPPAESPLPPLSTDAAPKPKPTPKPAPAPVPSSTRPTYDKYKLPPIDLLQKSDKEVRPTFSEDELKANQERIIETLSHFDIEVSPGDITRGSTITRYELYPAPGIRVERICNLERDLARSMKAERINILAPVPGRDTVAIEVANASKVKILLRDLIECAEWNSSRAHLPVSLGKDVYGATLIDDLADLPHALIAGTTGSGKSVCINTLLLSLLYRFSPDDLRLILIDPKVVELQVYNRLPHLVVPVVTEPKKVLLALRWVINEMEKRYRYMAKAGVRNIVAYNNRVRTPHRVEALDLAPQLENGDIPKPASSTEEPLPDRLPYIVVIIDELANLMQVAPADVENAIALLAAKARAAGIHLVIATQTPRAAVITGVIKTNVPARIAFQVPSGVDSRVILDESGAENLLGKGDLLYLRPGASKLIRAQGAFVSDEEVSRVIDFIAAQATPYYEQEIHAKLTKPNSGDSDLSEKDEELLAGALEVVKTEKRASTSLLQRRLGLGYGRAAWVIDQFESRGIIGSRDGAKDREILVDLDNFQL